MIPTPLSRSYTQVKQTHIKSSCDLGRRGDAADGESGGAGVRVRVDVRPIETWPKQQIVHQALVHKYLAGHKKWADKQKKLWIRNSQQVAPEISNRAAAHHRGRLTITRSEYSGLRVLHRLWSISRSLLIGV